MIKKKRGRPLKKIENSEISRIRRMLDSGISIENICRRLKRHHGVVRKIRDGFIFEDTEVNLFDGIPSGVLHRCPECGRKIYKPCRACGDERAIAAKRLKI